MLLLGDVGDAVGDVAVGELVQEVPNGIVLLLDNLKLLPDQCDLLLLSMKHPREEFQKAFRFHGPSSSLEQMRTTEFSNV